jgi:outer membrane biosynthesis protein TonB
MRILWMILIAASFTLASGQAAQAACENFVGGVCLDKKKAPAKKPVKKSTPKKKVTKKKKAAPKKAVASKPKVVKPAKSAANSCVKLSAGNASSLDFARGVVDTSVTVRNICSEAITVYVQLNACKSPRAYADTMVGRSRKKIKLRKGGSVSLRVSHQQGLRGASTLARTNAAYAGQKGTYPKFGC